MLPILAFEATASSCIVISPSISRSKMKNC